MTARVITATILLMATRGAQSQVLQVPVERDSAGVRIVENPSRATARVAFTLGPMAIDLGGADAGLDDEFNPRQQGSYRGIRLSDGSLALINTVRLQFYDPRGSATGSLGRVGSGPAEFRSLNATAYCRTRGDTLVAEDYRNGRTAVIYKRAVVRTFPLTMEFGGDMTGCFDDGTVLMRGGLPNFHTPTFSIRLNRIRLDGTLVNDLGDFVFRSPSPVTLYVNPTVQVFGQRVYIGDGATSEIRVLRTDGRLTQIIRTADTPRAITQADIEKLLDKQPETVRSMWRPPTSPTYSNFQIDPDGRLWVRDYPAIGTPSEHEGWTAFDQTGKLIGRLEVPRKIGDRRASVLAFGSNEVQLTMTDADGFIHIVFYPLVQTR